MAVSAKSIVNRAAAWLDDEMDFMSQCEPKALKECLGSLFSEVLIKDSLSAQVDVNDLLEQQFNDFGPAGKVLQDLLRLNSDLNVKHRVLTSMVTAWLSSIDLRLTVTTKKALLDDLTRFLESSGLCDDSYLGLTLEDIESTLDDLYAAIRELKTVRAETIINSAISKPRSAYITLQVNLPYLEFKAWNETVTHVPERLNFGMVSTLQAIANQMHEGVKRSAGRRLNRARPIAPSQEGYWTSHLVLVMDVTESQYVSWNNTLTVIPHEMESGVLACLRSLSKEMRSIYGSGPRQAYTLLESPYDSHSELMNRLNSKRSEFLLTSGGDNNSFSH